VRIVWGRHACDHCAMAISEQSFAAEVRTAPGEIARFDDFGCAVTWLEAHGGPDAASDFFFLMIPRPPRSTRNVTLFPYTTSSDLCSVRAT